VKIATKLSLNCPTDLRYIWDLIGLSMFKFTILFRRVDDDEALEGFFSGTVMLLSEQLAGLVQTEVSRVSGKPGGESRFQLVYELYFVAADDFFRALASQSGIALMQALKPWADAKLITWFYAESWEQAVIGDE
jgi:hypothetical protein